MLKQTPATKEELDYTRWKIWEPLRRNRFYENAYAELPADDLIVWANSETFTEFCKQWKLLYPISPKTEFSALTDKARRPWLANPFREYYIPIYDSAAFVRLNAWIEAEKFLVLWIDRCASKKQIEKAIKKELDEWWSDKWINFYGGQHVKGVTDAVRVVSTVGDYLKVLINLESYRNVIESGLKGVIKAHVAPKTGAGIKRLQPKKWAKAFALYDVMTRNISGLTAPSLEMLSLSLGQNKTTIHEQYKRVWKAIYPYLDFKSRTDKPLIRREFQQPAVTVVEKRVTGAPVETVSFVENEHWDDEDCIHCRSSFSVQWMKGFSVCVECGCEQKTGKSMLVLLADKGITPL